MALTLIVRWVTGSFSAKLDLDELETIRRSVADDAVLAESFQMVFSDVVATANRATFLEAVDRILIALTRVPKSVVYSLYHSPMPGVRPGQSSGAGVSIDGQHCLIMGGVDTCTLTRMRETEKGRYVAESIEDIRNVKVITTDFGDVKIRKTSRAGRTSKLLKELRNAIEHVPENSDVVVELG